jgi:hypothetical protein
MKRLGFAVPLLATMALVGCAAESGTSPTVTHAKTPASGIPGCVPECQALGGADPGTLPTGPYTTQHFLDGYLTVTFATPWESHEDRPVEFSAAPLGKWDTHRVLFWSDILPVGPDGKQVAGISRTTVGMLAWFAARPNLLVSEPQPATIGVDHLPASVIDISIGPHAVNEDPGCPPPPGNVCVGFFTWPNEGFHAATLGGRSVLRLYLADVAYGGQSHLLAVGIEGQNASDLAAWLPTAEALIATAKAPVSRA